MGEIADMMLEQWECDDCFGGYNDRDEPSDFLDLTDSELVKQTSKARVGKIKSIRKSFSVWPHKLSAKQRYCLAAWLAGRDA